jgi:hypothetical protein
MMVLPWDLCSYADIVAEYVDNKVLDSKTTYLELHSWFRFRDDTFVTVERYSGKVKYVFYPLNSFDKYLQFTMDMGGKSLHFFGFTHYHQR